MKYHKSGWIQALLWELLRHICLVALLALILAPGLAQYGFIGVVGYSLYNVGLLALLCYIPFLYILTAQTNTDFLIEEKSITAIPTLWGFRKRRQFDFKDIKTITFRSEWADFCLDEKRKPRFLYAILYFFLILIFPEEYKWVKITDIHNKTHTFYCFGLDFTCCEDDLCPCIRDVYYDLERKGVSAKWTADK